MQDIKEFELFRQEFQIVAADSILKRFDGDLNLQILVSLNIAEKRLDSKLFPTVVNETEWKILQMSQS